MNIPVAEETLFAFLFLRIPLLIFFSIATLAVQALRSKLYGYRFYLSLYLAFLHQPVSSGAGPELTCRD